MAENGTYPEGVFLKWAHDRRQLFRSACREWPDFMMKPGCELFVLLSDDELCCWGHLRLRSTRDAIGELVWVVDFDFSNGVRRVWPFPDLEAAVHHWMTYRDDFPFVDQRWLRCQRSGALELAAGYFNPVPDNPGSL